MSEPRIVLYRGTWCIAYRDRGTTKRLSLRTKDRDEAKRQFIDYLKQPPTTGETTGNIMQAYLEDRKSIATHAMTSMVVRKHLTPHFGFLRPDQIHRATCRAYTAARTAKGVKNWTIRRELGILRTALLWADRNTPARIELPPEGIPRERYLRKEEFAALLDQAKAEHIKTFIVLALGTAGRMSALLQLTWDRVDFEHGIIKLATGQHSRKGRATVPMNAMVRTYLTEAYKARTCDFVIEFGGRAVANIKKGFSEAARRAGLVGVSPHVIRHTAAVWMALDGVPIEKIAQFLGHTSTAITYKHYAKYSPSHLADAAQAVNI